MINLENCERYYLEFTTPTNDSETQLLKNGWSFLRKKLRITCIEQLLYLLRKSRNKYSFSTVEMSTKKRRMIEPFQLTLRILPDKKTLMIACPDKRSQLAVCWFKDCADKSGDSIHICCAQHEAEIMNDSKNRTVQVYTKVANQMVQLTETEHCQQRRQFDPLADKKNPALRPVHKILKTFAALGRDVWKKEYFFDPRASIDESRRAELASKLNGHTFHFKDFVITYDSERAAFLFKDKTDDTPTWKAICSGKLNCFLLASDGCKGCFSHPDKPNWRNVWKEELLRLGQVKVPYDFDETAREKCRIAIRGGKNVTFADGQANFFLRKNGDIGIRVITKARYFICVSSGCINLVSSGENIRTCLDCRQWSVALLYFSDVNQFTSLRFRHADMFLEPNADFPTIIKDKITHILQNPTLRGKFTILKLHHCDKGADDNGLEESMAWQSAFMIYGKIEAFLLGCRAKFSNSNCYISKSEWCVVQELCKLHNLEIQVTGELLDITSPASYGLVSQEPNLYEKDYSKTIYKIAVKDLLYIGQRTIFAHGGREGFISSKCHLLDNSRITSKEIFDLLKMEGYQGIGLEDVPASTVAIVTDVGLSPFVPETMIMLAYSLNEQTLKASQIQLINARYSTTEWTQYWFTELQFIAQTLFGKTIRIVKNNDLFTADMSLLFSKREDRVYHTV